MGNEVEANTEEVDYLKYSESGIKVKDLDVLKDLALGVSTKNPIKSVVSGIQILILCAYWYLRGRLIEEEILREKNKQSQKQTNKDREEVDAEAPKL